MKILVESSLVSINMKRTDEVRRDEGVLRIRPSSHLIFPSGKTQH